MREILYNAMLPMGASLTLNSLYRLGRVVGDLMWAALPRRRREAVESIIRHLDCDAETGHSLALASFRQSAMSFLEIFHTRSMDRRFFHDRLEYEDAELAARFFASSRPMVAVTAHLGSWELLGGLLAGFPGRSGCQVVVRLPQDAALAGVLMHMRSHPGIIVLPHRDVARLTLPYLRKGGLSAFLVDHNCKRAEAEFLPFLGEIAAVNKGPALLALRSKALVWPAFMVRLPGGRFRLVLREPLDTATMQGSREERLREICRFYTSAVEDAVRQYPEQWFWMHRRWKTQP